MERFFAPPLSAGSARWGSDLCRWVAWPLFSLYINMTFSTELLWGRSHNCGGFSQECIQVTGYSKCLALLGGEKKAWWTPDALWDAMSSDLCLWISPDHTEWHTPVNDDDAVQTVFNPMYCGIWPSGLRRIYTVCEGRGDQICMILQN